MSGTSPVLEVLLVAAIVSNGLLAGLFLAFACAIAPGLHGVSNVGYVQAFRSINVAILSPWFLLVFFAAPLTAGAHAVLDSLQTTTNAPLLAWAGAACAVISFTITAGRNVPLNTQLDRAQAGTAPEYRFARDRFEARWNHWNLARTVASIGSFISLIMAGVLP